MKASIKPSELEERTWSIVIALPLFLFLVLFSEWTLVLAFFLLSFGSLREYGRLVYGKEEEIFFTGFSVVFLFLLYSSLITVDYLTIFWLGYVLFLVLVVWSLKKPQKMLERMAFCFLGLLYCSLFPFFWVKMGITYDRVSVVLFALPVWMNDICAYLVGRRWGKHKIVPQISGGKSWEGLAGGIGAATLMGLVLTASPISFSLPQGLLSGLAIASVSFLGDIWESALKRRAGVKDSGDFLPGHGGILDRFDSFFLVGPLVYLLRLSWGG